jgi:CDP-paratose 2-epimerase
VKFDHVVVTGGAGFIGANLAVRLRAANIAKRVTAIDNLKRRGSELQLHRLRDADVQFMHGDTRIPEDVEAAGHFDLLIDCAAEPSVHAGTKSSPKPLFDHNLLGTIHCLEACRRNNAAFLLLSTSRVYPVQALNDIAAHEDETRFVWDADALPHGVSVDGVSEAMSLEGHRTFYGATKLCSELLAIEYAAGYGMRTLINRCGVVAGPWQMGKVDQGVVTLWLAAHHFNRPLTYNGWGGTGKQVRDILHIDDLADLVERQLMEVDSWSAEIYNVGGSRAVSASLKELTDVARRVTGRSIEIGSRSSTDSVDVRIYLSDNSRVSAQFGWRPTRDVEKIASDTHAWLRSHEHQLRPIFT